MGLSSIGELGVIIVTLPTDRGRKFLELILGQMRFFWGIQEVKSIHECGE